MQPAQTSVRSSRLASPMGLLLLSISFFENGSRNNAIKEEEEAQIFSLSSSFNDCYGWRNKNKAPPTVCCFTNWLPDLLNLKDELVSWAISPFTVGNLTSWTRSILYSTWNLSLGALQTAGMQFFKPIRLWTYPDVITTCVFPCFWAGQM